MQVAGPASIGSFTAAATRYALHKQQTSFPYQTCNTCSLERTRGIRWLRSVAAAGGRSGLLQTSANSRTASIGLCLDRDGDRDQACLFLGEGRSVP